MEKSQTDYNTKKKAIVMIAFLFSVKNTFWGDYHRT